MTEFCASERHIALRNAHEVQAEDDYFDARPSFDDSITARSAFMAGYERGFDKGTELAQAPQLQPIRSVPKDGTHILAIFEDSDTCYVICWVDAQNDIRAELGSAKVGWHLAYDGEFVEDWRGPTHYMRLPSRP